MEDRSGLFNEIQNFSQRKLKKVETNVVTALGDKLVEKRSAKGLKTVAGDENSSQKEIDSNKKLDLQVGLIMPGLMIGKLSMQPPTRRPGLLSGPHTPEFES